MRRPSGPHSASAQPKSLPTGSLPSRGQMDNKEAIKETRGSGDMVRATETRVSRD